MKKKRPIMKKNERKGKKMEFKKYKKLYLERSDKYDELKKI